MQIFWSGTGELVAICAEDSYYVLRFDRDAYNTRLEQGPEIDDEGVEEAFELVAEISEGYVCFHRIVCSPIAYSIVASRPGSGSGTASFTQQQPTDSTISSAPSRTPLPPSIRTSRVEAPCIHH